MQLPPPLRRAVEQELASCDANRLRAAAAQLSQSYRDTAVHEKAAPSATAVLSTPEQRAAYLAVRMPATFAAVVAALQWTREACDEEILSVLDLGSGPGTALWAASEVFPTIASATAVERNPQLIELARRLCAAGGPHPPSSGECGEAVRSKLPANTAWIAADLTTSLPEGAWDLVLCSYALNELPASRRAEFIRQAWARTAKLLVIIEPGTMVGFANVLAARTFLLASGAILAAPCPNALACPMSASASGRRANSWPVPVPGTASLLTGGDWCHFPARVERTSDHRRLKDASLGHEDEKFSYIAFSRGAVPAHDARIVRHPRIFSGYTQLTLCREGELANATVTRSMKEDWRRLKRLGWGDRW
jgi:ribosomal protein RSM22 (predicted rRNA methylase)